jgi:hypothetical protein
MAAPAELASVPGALAWATADVSGTVKKVGPSSVTFCGFVLQGRRVRPRISVVTGPCCASAVCVQFGGDLNATSAAQLCASIVSMLEVRKRCREVVVGVAGRG